jgi:hypothetical protein
VQLAVLVDNLESLVEEQGPYGERCLVQYKQYRPKDFAGGVVIEFSSAFWREGL